MANLYIAEFSKLAGTGGQVGQAPQHPAVTTQKVSFTTAAPSTAFSGSTSLLRVIPDADCHIIVGGATATAAHPLYKAGVEYFFGVQGGDKLSVYDGVS